MQTVLIGRTGRPHGIRGELSLIVDDHYLDDLERARAVLIGDPPIPYFIERLIGGGKPRVKLETFDRREQVRLLANRPLHLPAEEVAQVGTGEETPYDRLVGYHISSPDYPLLGPIEAIVDLPEHYLAEITHAEKEVLIPLHPDLIERIDEGKKTVLMDLPLGLLDID
jgi:16S rRNA processing protein RimM